MCMCAPVGTTGAQSIEEARSVYAEGRFTEAAELAQNLDTSEGYALAANSLAIYSYYIAPESEKEGSFRRAAELARKAIRLDTSNPEAYLQLAHATGRLAQVTGTWEALNEGYAGQVHDTIQEALRLAPDMAAAHLSLAAWHAGTVSIAGFFIASLLYEASEEDALVHFDRSLELAPQEKIVFFEYALGLLGLDADDNRGKARDLLERAIALPAKDAHDRIIHRKAVEQLAALDGE
ncbi:MAG: hypothetical protein OXL95_02125 [Nitrospira sp.]|nr:hypothetical protein [Nitrospira sp.]